MAQTEISAPPGTQVVVVTRTINAPREIVFKTVTDPLLIPNWWGPRRLSTKVLNMDVMTGGIWRFLQKDTEGKEYGFHGVYHEVLAPERLTYTSEFEGMPGHVTLITDEFAVDDGKTIITSTTVFQSVEDRDQMLQWGMEEGTTEMTNRLNELLAIGEIQESNEVQITKKDRDKGGLTITRVFDAPRERVWERWTEPSQFMCWWGPKDFTAPYARFDLRPGGKFLTCMRGPDGKDYWDTGTYEAIDELSRIVYTDYFADEHGNIVPASYYGMDSDIPIEISVGVTFEDLGGKTKLTLEHCGMPQGEMLENARIGWNQSFDKLAECLG